MDSIDLRINEEIAEFSQSLVLDDFLPYRLAVLSNTISRGLARLYERRFGVSVSEWRVLANLARFGPMSAHGVCDRSAMDKVQVSRAVAKAVENGLIDRAVDPYDRRRSVLTLTAKGRAIHDEILPLAQEFQNHLRSGLSREENDRLQDMLSRLLDRAISPRFLDS